MGGAVAIPITAALAQVRVMSESGDRVGELVEIPRRYPLRVGAGAVAEQFANAIDVEADDGPRGAHRLQYRVGHSLVRRRQDQHLACVEPSIRIRLPTRQMNAIAVFEPGSKPAQSLGQRAA